MKRLYIRFLIFLICATRTASLVCAAQSTAKVAGAKAAAPAAAPMTPDVFIKLSPEEKFKQAAKMDPQALKTIVASNLDILKKYKICPNCYLENVTIDNADLSGANLFNTVFKDVVLNNVNLSKANFTAGVMAGCKLNNCNLSEMIGTGMLIAGTAATDRTTFTKCNLNKAVLRQTRINADIINCTLDELQADGGTKIKLSRIVNSTFKKANLQWLEVNTVSCDYANWTEADLRNALIIEADMHGNIFTQAHLENAIIIYTNLNDITADGVSLQGTNFIYGVGMRGANLAKAAVSPETNWGGVQFCDTLMPDKKIKDDQCGKMAVYHSWQRDIDIVGRNRNRLLLTKGCRRFGVAGTDCFLEEADLRGRDFSGVDFAQAWMPKADLRGSNLSGTNLRGAFLEGARVDASTIFSGAQFCRTYMPDGSVRNDHCGIAPAPKKTAKESKAQAAAATAADAEKNKATLLATKSCPGCNLRGMNLSQSDLTEAKLASALLVNANLSGCSLNRSDLQNADLSGADMQGASLDGSNCSGAKFKKTKMQLSGYKVNFSRALLFNANLQGDFHDSIFANANLSGSTFTKTDLEGVDFKGANTTNTKFDEARFCCTRMPDGTINYQNCPPSKSERQNRSACKALKPDWFQ